MSDGLGHIAASQRSLHDRAVARYGKFTREQLDAECDAVQNWIVELEAKRAAVERDLRDARARNDELWAMYFP